MPRQRIPWPARLLAATGQTRELLADIVQLYVVRQFGQEVRIDRLYGIARVDIIIEADADVSPRTAVRCIEAEALRVACIAGVIVIRSRREIDQRLTSRINR